MGMALMYGKRVSPERMAAEISRQADKRLHRAIRLLHEAEDRFEDLYAITTALYAEIDYSDRYNSHPEAERARAASSAAREVYTQRMSDVEALQVVAQRAAAKVTEYKRIITHQLDTESASQETGDHHGGAACDMVSAYNRAAASAPTQDISGWGLIPTDPGHSARDSEV